MASKAARAWWVSVHYADGETDCTAFATERDARIAFDVALGVAATEPGGIRHVALLDSSRREVASDPSPGARRRKGAQKPGGVSRAAHRPSLGGLGVETPSRCPASVAESVQRVAVDLIDQGQLVPASSRLFSDAHAAGPGTLAGPGRPQAGLDLSLGHLRTCIDPSIRGDVRWRVWVLVDDVWKRSAGAMPEGAALSYATHVRHASVWVFEAELFSSRDARNESSQGGS